MSVSKKCPVCGSTNLEAGNIQSTGKIYFRPQGTRFLKLKTNDVPIMASMCMACGHVMLAGDLSKAGKLLEKAVK